MIIDIHTHLFVDGWVPRSFFHGVARFITHEFAKQGIHQTNEEVGDALLAEMTSCACHLLHLLAGFNSHDPAGRATKRSITRRNAGKDSFCLLFRTHVQPFTPAHKRAAHQWG
jgi:hypothetical protein